MMYFDIDSLEGNGNYGEPQETREKLFKLTDYVYCSIGGLMSIGHAYVSRLIPLLDANDHLDKCKEYLSQIVHEVNVEEKDPLFKKYHTGNTYTVTLAGFYPDGTTGLVGIGRGKIECMHTSDTGGLLFHLFAPTKEVQLMKDEIMDIPKHLWENSDLLNGALNHFANIQAAVSFTHPEMVSSTMVYMGLIKYPEKGFIPFEGEVDLKSLIASFEIEEPSKRGEE